VRSYNFTDWSTRICESAFKSGKGSVAACFFGEGATGEGEFHEALNLSSLWKLPLIFVCENNQWAAGNSIEATRTVVDISLHAAAYGMPGASVDGNDVVAVHEATVEAVERARRGEGPTLVVCSTFRSLFHAMRNAPPPGTRPAELLAAWKQHVDWIVVDTPTIMAVTEPCIVAHMTNAVLFVVGAEKTSRHAAKRALDQLDRVKSKILGGVLNRVDLQHNPYYYSHYYRHEYSTYYQAVAKV